MTVVGIVTVGMLAVGGAFAVVSSCAMAGLLLIASDFDDLMHRLEF